MIGIILLIEYRYARVINAQLVTKITIKGTPFNKNKSISHTHIHAYTLAFVAFFYTFFVSSPNDVTNFRGLTYFIPHTTHSQIDGQLLAFIETYLIFFPLWF